MKNTTAITWMFLDVGGVLLTNGWGHQSRALAAKAFDLNLDEMEDRHHLTFDTYEVGKLTLEDCRLTKESSMKPANPRILTINGGSSSIKFALFEAGDSLRRILEGGIERIGLPEATLRVKGLDQADNLSRPVTASDHTLAVGALMDWIEQRSGNDALTAVGHRVVHGGPKYSKPQRITAEMVEELNRLSPFDPEHLPEEILLTEAFHRRFPDLPQVACFDTAFHQNLPRVAQLLPIPRRYEAQGVRRYGFHGLSYSFLMGELARLAGTEAAQGRVTVRARICDGLGFLGIELEEKRNAASEGVISAAASRVAVRVIRTDEEQMIAKTVCRVLDLSIASEEWHSDHATKYISRSDPFPARGPP